ncbi:MAG: hypothetical protein H6631_07375 [Anaerolineaceae bacterium]|nr:hypothetical protein [Anaerolineaceae bacterium]
MPNKTSPFLCLPGLALLLVGCTHSGQLAAAPSITLTATATPTARHATSTPTLTPLPPFPTASPSPAPILEPSPSAPPTLNAPTPTPNPIPPSSLFEIPWEDRSIFKAGLLDSQQSILDKLPGARFTT